MPIIMGPYHAHMLRQIVVDKHTSAATDNFKENKHTSGELDESLKICQRKNQSAIESYSMLENDLLLSTFASKYLKTMSVEQVQQYDTLINKPSNDWDIYYWATNKKPTPPEYETEGMTLLKSHVLNAQRESRRMPDL